MDFEEVKQRIDVRQGDITDVEADAIVNEANTDLILGAGVSGAVGRKGGAVIQEECDKLGSAPIGAAVATSAGELKARYVIHAVSGEIGHFATEKNIARATRSALRKAEELRLHTVALPAVGTGVAAFPADRCARLMLDAAARHLARTRSLERVTFVVTTEEDLAAFRAAFEELAPASLRPPSRPSRPSRGRRGRGSS